MCRYNYTLTRTTPPVILAAAGLLQSCPADLRHKRRAPIASLLALGGVQLDYWEMYNAPSNSGWAPGARIQLRDKSQAVLTKQKLEIKAFMERSP